MSVGDLIGSGHVELVVNSVGDVTTRSLSQARGLTCLGGTAEYATNEVDATKTVNVSKCGNGRVWR